MVNTAAATTTIELTYDEVAQKSKKSKSYGRFLLTEPETIVELRRRVEASAEVQKKLKYTPQHMHITLSNGDVLDILVAPGSFGTDKTTVEFVPVEETDFDKEEDKKTSSSVKGKEEEKSLEKRLKDAKPVLTLTKWAIGILLLLVFSIPFFWTTAQKMYGTDTPTLVSETYEKEGVIRYNQGPGFSSNKPLSVEEQLQLLGY